MIVGYVVEVTSAADIRGVSGTGTPAKRRVGTGAMVGFSPVWRHRKGSKARTSERENSTVKALAENT